MTDYSPEKQARSASDRRTDESLMDMLRSGDLNVVSELERRYGEELRRFCWRMCANEALADDIVQEVFAACCRTGEGINPTGSLRGWLYKVARNRCIDETRRKKPGGRISEMRSSPYGGGHRPVDPRTTPAARAAKDDRAELVQAIVDEMEDELRSVLIMRYFQDLPRAEIAEACGVDVPTVKARLARASAKLREELTKFGID